MDDDTIAALATPNGRGGIAVIRISGENTRAILKAVIKDYPAKCQANRVYHSYVKKNCTNVDECLFTFFKGPESYTGEDVAEISIHSNPLIIEEILELILLNSARSALPGEFTYRAFRNGKLDLIQAEAVNELINANSKYYAHMKFDSLEGKLSAMVSDIKQSLIDLAIKTETKLEFEEDQFLAEITFKEELSRALTDLEHVIDNSRFNELLNRGLKVVIVGKVNVGKSSLFNSLLLEDRSITSPIPGTTRDFIREKIYLDGFPVEIVDVAGISRSRRDGIESEGIQRSYEKVVSSDAVIFMLDGSRETDADDLEIYKLIRDKKKLVAINKSDIAGIGIEESIHKVFNKENIVSISVKQSKNLEEISVFLKGLLTDLKTVNQTLIINQRQKGHLQELLVVLKKIKQMVAGLNAGSEAIELIAEEIRRALEIIGELTGEITSQDILNGIFSGFCIGK